MSIQPPEHRLSSTLTDHVFTPLPKPTLPGARAALAWYYEAKGAHDPVLKSQIDLFNTREFIQNVWLTERLESGFYQIRLASTSVADTVGAELTGQIYNPASDTMSFKDQYDEALAGNSPVIFDHIVTSQGENIVHSQIAILPLSNDHGDIKYCLCAFDLYD